MTHEELTTRAEKWLRNSLHCRVVFCELTAYTRSGETPDAIGFLGNATILIECKTSRSDFCADRKKPSRSSGYPALGNWRFYLTSPSLLDGLQLPAGWGWYEVRGCQVRHANGEKYSNMREKPCVSDWQSERAMLVSALARKQSTRPDLTANEKAL